MKRCSRCETSKPVEEFNRDRSRKDGRGSRCRPCAKAYHRALREAARKNPCQIEDCGKPSDPGGYCSMHRVRIHRHGDPSVVKSPIQRRGPDSPRWVGEAACYVTAHDRLRKGRGKASDHPCEVERCNAQAEHWAYDYSCPDEREEVLQGGTIPSPYSLEPARYHPLCVPCHRKADSAINRARRGRTAESAEFERQLLILEEYIAVKYAVTA